MGYEQQFTTLIPTPTASEYRGAAANRCWMPPERERERERRGGGGKYRHRLCELLECTPLGTIGRMNPEYLEWLMGYPIGWSELNASGTR